MSNRVLTLNTWQEKGPWQDRWEIILRGLQKEKPDIAAFQEVFNEGWSLQCQERTGYPFRVFPKEPGGLMILTRYPVKESGCLTMKTQSPTEDYLRYALYAALEIEGRKVAFFNTHLSWKLDEGEVRMGQVEELLQFIHDKTGNGPVFVTGDFNAPPGTTEIKKMMLKGGFVDLFGALHPKDSGLTWNNKNPFTAGSSVKMPDRRIDFIFMRGIPITQVNSVKLVLTESEQGIYASDHFGVIAEVSI